MYHSFTYYVPTKVVFGKDAEAETGRLTREFGGKCALVIYGGKSATRTGILDRVVASLQEAGVEVHTLGGVVPNPRLSLVYRAIEMGKQHSVDFLIGIGGGSAIDTAKAAAYGLAEKEFDVWDLYAHTRKARAALPVGAVLTISAAGSETSNSSVITNEETGEKRGYNDDLVRPKFAVMNPDLTSTLPDYQTQSGCVDMMMHTMERYFTNGGNMEITDSIAEGLMRTVMENARILHRDPGNSEARAEVMWAGSLVHNDLTGCGARDRGDFAAHGLEHELGGMFDVTHGAGLAAIWPSWARYVYRDCLPRFVRFALNVMGVEKQATDEETALAGIAAVEDFYRSIDMPTNMRELGIEPDDAQILELARRAAEAAGGRKGSAKVLYEQDMAEIYRMAR